MCQLLHIAAVYWTAQVRFLNQLLVARDWFGRDSVSTTAYRSCLMDSSGPDCLNQAF
jgi:hypothetical protein